MAKFLTDNQLSFVKEAIQDELLKRGITAKISKFEERNYKLEVETESFQTVLLSVALSLAGSSDFARHYSRNLG